METLKRYQIFVYLILIIMIMTAVKARYGIRSQMSDVSSQLTPTVFPTVTTVPTAEATPTINPNDDYPLWRELPYIGKGFTVDKYTAPMTLQMTLTTATQSAAVKEVTVWLNSFREITKQHKIIVVKTPPSTKVDTSP